MFGCFRFIGKPIIFPFCVQVKGCFIHQLTDLKLHSLRSQHLEQEDYDKERTKHLESQGYKLIRFWNHEVSNNIEGVILAIIHMLEEGEKP